MSIAGETSPASPGHRVHQGDSIMENGRRKKSSNRRSNSSNGVRADVGSVFARVSGFFFSMTHLLSPDSASFQRSFPREPVIFRRSAPAPLHLPPSLVHTVCRACSYVYFTPVPGETARRHSESLETCML